MLVSEKSNITENILTLLPIIGQWLNAKVLDQDFSVFVCYHRWWLYVSDIDAGLLDSYCCTLGMVLEMFILMNVDIQMQTDNHNHLCACFSSMTRTVFNCQILGKTHQRSRKAALNMHSTWILVCEDHVATRSRINIVACLRNTQVMTIHFDDCLMSRILLLESCCCFWYLMCWNKTWIDGSQLKPITITITVTHTSEIRILHALP